ncbi:MAG TPA: SPOR domain-containing protein, partial [Steroidobacteraceae bacterium]
MTSEIWHLTIDDLLEPLPASPRLGGPGPFVINLSASTAPISVPMKAVAEHPGTHVYQIQRTEDRRVRYRLRFGPFETEAEAEALLSTVREIYPSALTATAEPEDLRNIEAIKNKIEAQQLAMVKAAMSKAAAASLPNGRPGIARAATPEAAERPPGAPTDGEALPTSPPPAWLALRTAKPVPAEQPVELDVPAPAAKPSPKPPPVNVKAAAPAPAKSTRGFAPARWSAAARAFVPSADFPSAAASASTVNKTQAGAPAAGVSPATAAIAPASPATNAAPARPDVPTVSVVPESLIPVLSDSVAVPRSMPASRPAAPIPALKISTPAPASSPAPAAATSAG